MRDFLCSSLENGVLHFEIVYIMPSTSQVYQPKFMMKCNGIIII
jgi:hypothetical protein